jgi:hypothetical protein
MAGEAPDPDRSRPMRIVDKTLHVVIAVPAVVLAVLTTALALVGCGVFIAVVSGYRFAQKCLVRLLPARERAERHRPPRKPSSP